MATIVFVDLETTGLDAKKNGLTQIAAIMTIDNITVASYSSKIQPHIGCVLDKEALKIQQITPEDILANPEYREEDIVYKEFTKWIYSHKEKDVVKCFFAGYNSSFDNQFMWEFAKRNNDYFGKHFYSGSIDVMGFALYHLRHRRETMPNFKLETVAREILGDGRVDEFLQLMSMHDARTDIWLTVEIFATIEYDKRKVMV